MERYFPFSMTHSEHGELFAFACILKKRFSPFSAYHRKDMHSKGKKPFSIKEVVNIVLTSLFSML